MQPVNIDLKSDIVTEGDNLISSEPKFTHKNSLLFNGIASNMKKLTGNGICQQAVGTKFTKRRFYDSR